MSVKLKAYTLTEALITILLSGILILLGYTLFNILNKQMHDYRTAGIFEVDYALFDATFNRDTYNATNYKVLDNSLVLINYEEVSVRYSFNSKQIVRNTTLASDTFAIPVIEYKFNTEEIDHNKTPSVTLKLQFIKDTVSSYYKLEKPIANKINNLFFNEN